MKESETVVGGVHSAICREKDAMAARLTESSKFVFPSAAELARADEVRILELAVEREIVANRTYLEMASAAGSGAAKEMFLALAKEEETHSKILRAEIDSIGQNGFWFDMQEFTMEQSPEDHVRGRFGSPAYGPPRPRHARPHAH